MRLAIAAAGAHATTPVLRHCVYRAEGLPIHLVGVERNRERRTVVGFEVEHLPHPSPKGPRTPS